MPFINKMLSRQCPEHCYHEQNRISGCDQMNANPQDTSDTKLTHAKSMPYSKHCQTYHQGSRRMTVEAAVRFSPTPPALRDTNITVTLSSVAKLYHTWSQNTERRQTVRPCSLHYLVAANCPQSSNQSSNRHRTSTASTTRIPWRVKVQGGQPSRLYLSVTPKMTTVCNSTTTLAQTNGRYQKSMMTNTMSCRR